MRSELWWAKRVQHVTLTSSFFSRWVLLTCSKAFRPSHHLFSVLWGTCEPLACSWRNKQSFMNKRQGLTTLKETKQRGTLDQRGLAHFQGQIQRQMLILFQKRKRNAPLPPSFTGRALFISPASQAVLDLWVLKTPNTFFFHQDPGSPIWPRCPCFWMVCFPPSACRASLKQLCLVQKVEIGCLNCS